VMKTVNQNAQGEIDKFKNSASSVRGLLE
jgi:hypothetical protein